MDMDTMMRMTDAQRRFMAQVGTRAPFWDAINGWLHPRLPSSLAHGTAMRTVEALLRMGVIRIDGDGYIVQGKMP